MSHRSSRRGDRPRDCLEDHILREIAVGLARENAELANDVNDLRGVVRDVEAELFDLRSLRDSLPPTQTHDLPPPPYTPRSSQQDSTEIRIETPPVYRRPTPVLFAESPVRSTSPRRPVQTSSSDTPASVVSPAPTNASLLSPSRRVSVTMTRPIASGARAHSPRLVATLPSTPGRVIPSSNATPTVSPTSRLPAVALTTAISQPSPAQQTLRRVLSEESLRLLETLPDYFRRGGNSGKGPHKLPERSSPGVRLAPDAYVLPRNVPEWRRDQRYWVVVKGPVKGIYGTWRDAQSGSGTWGSSRAVWSLAAAQALWNWCAPAHAHCKLVEEHHEIDAFVLYLVYIGYTSVERDDIVGKRYRGWRG